MNCFFVCLYAIKIMEILQTNFSIFIVRLFFINTLTNTLNPAPMIDARSKRNMFVLFLIVISVRRSKQKSIRMFCMRNDSI